MRYQFIADHREEFPVRRMCKLLNVSSIGYYAWGKRPASKREPLLSVAEVMANQQLVEEIKTIQEESYETYGSPRVYEELQENGVACSENRVARLIREEGIQAKQSKRYKVTTKANKSHPVAPNLLDRDFTAEAPNQKWTAAITFIPTWAGSIWLL